MEIKIKSMSLEFFKGIENATFEFSPELTLISGRNGSGKTTVYDAFLWLLFGKDSSGSANFEIKTIDPKTGKPYPKIDHRVSAVLDTGEAITTTLSRTLREKWVKPRGQAEAEFAGHETIYEVDGTPVLKKDFEAVVARLAPESVFRLVADVAAFFRMTTAEQRAILLDVSGVPALSEIANTERLKAFVESINGQDLEAFGRSIRAQIKPIKEELNNLPPRISELKAQAAGIVGDYAQKQEELKGVIKEMNAIEAAISSGREKYKQQRAESAKVLAQIKALEADKVTALIEANQSANAGRETASRKLSEMKTKLARLQTRRDVLNEKIQAKKEMIQDSIETRNALLKQYTEETQKKWTAPEGPENCGSCGQVLPQDPEKLQTLEAEFNQRKAAKMSEITTRGQAAARVADTLKAETEEFNKKVATIQTDIAELQAQIDGFELPESRPVESGEIEASFDEQIQALQKTISEPEESEDVASGRKKRAELQQQRDNLIIEISKIDQRQNIESRAKRLEEKQRDLSQQIADLEKQEFDAETLGRLRSSAIEKDINDQIEGISFRLFRPLVNGGVEECCDCLVGGVPYHSANTAAQINAGVQVIKMLSSYYGVSIPVFVDRCESVNNVQKTGGQMVLLEVTLNEFKVEQL